MDQLTKEEAADMLAKIEALLGARLLTYQEALIFRQGVKYGGYLVFCIKASPRFITGLAVFLAACTAIKAYWPLGG